MNNDLQLDEIVKKLTKKSQIEVDTIVDDTFIRFFNHDTKKNGMIYKNGDFYLISKQEIHPINARLIKKLIDDCKDELEKFDLGVTYKTSFTIFIRGKEIRNLLNFHSFFNDRSLKKYGFSDNQKLNEGKSNLITLTND
jgi:hypothetical protein